MDSQMTYETEQRNPDGVPEGQNGLHTCLHKLLALGGNSSHLRPLEPASGSVVSDTWTTLAWQAGDSSALHQLYISDDFILFSVRRGSAIIGKLPGNSRPRPQPSRTRRT